MKFAKTLLLLFILNALTGCAPVYFESDFHGIVIDRETEEPISNVVVLANWWNTFCLWGAGGEVCDSSYNDTYVTLTNEQGHFDIPGKGLRLFSTLEKMTFLVYKSSYTRHGLSTERKNALDGYKLDSNGRTIFNIKKLSLKEFKRIRVRSFGLPEHEAPFETVEPYLNEYNKERIWLGYSPIKTWKGKPLIIPKPEHPKKIVKVKSHPQLTGPCKLEYKVYQENGEWKIGYYPGGSSSELSDDRPECVKEREEMERLYNKHIIKK